MISRATFECRDRGRPPTGTAERTDTDKKRASYEGKLKRLEAERQKLLQAHYADAVPLDLMKSEQARITEEIASTNNALQGAVFDAERIEQTAERVVQLLKNCQTTYEEMGPHERRLMNQAFFHKIWVTEEGVVGWEY